MLRIQKRLALLLRVHASNAVICAWPWWIMWVPVVIAFAGLGEYPSGAATPLWI